MALKYDFIIAGSGLAGLSLLHQLLSNKSLSQKKILVIDSAKKNLNDRTWCFWEKEPGPFESLVCHAWDTLQFFSPKVTKEFQMKEYRYKMIQSGDFYSQVLDLAEQHPQVVFIHDEIQSIQEEQAGASVQTTQERYLADYVFNSTAIFNPKMDEGNTLLQHFMGWFIKTDTPVFTSGVATLMDFTLSQQHGATFMYMLPTSPTEALVEYTLFSPRVLEKEEYVQALENYIEKNLHIHHYEITHQEFGIIPMSKAKFQASIGPQQRIINIGTAGGHTKPSTGYTFQFVQKQVAKIAQRLEAGDSPLVEPTWREKMFLWYDMTLLDVLMSKSLTGEQIFSHLFSKVDPERILAFLANESGFWEEFSIRNAVPQAPFITSGMKVLFQ
ncbi:lycopene cyclase family protein [Mongoliitalea daihaiensis]|uniref:lycopene cyclase family protein n=1 Tax=Mongoliitalea daihaiensis TaxID=2782006 RepID=UPI001F1C6A5F|nr:lycopene cyclase family protein [Mongoliitalea daihaiensis]UJP65732.1 lycopene cyclase [Mongoliitalea daihaiensis]